MNNMRTFFLCILGLASSVTVVKLWGETAVKDSWDGSHYKKNSSAQRKVALAVIESIPFKGTETVLDIGCGNGFVTTEIAKRLPKGRVVGLDKSPSMLKSARENFSTVSNLSFIQEDATNFNLNQKFDYVTSFFTIHWIEDQTAVLNSIKKVLKPGGRIALVLGPADSPMQTVFVTFKEQGRWPAATTMREKKFHGKTVEQFEDLLKKNGFTPLDVHDIHKTISFKNVEHLVRWMMGWIPFTTGFQKQEALEFAHEFAQEMLIQLQQNPKNQIDLPFTPLYVRARFP